MVWRSTPTAICTRTDVLTVHIPQLPDCCVQHFGVLFYLPSWAHCKHCLWQSMGWDEIWIHFGLLPFLFCFVLVAPPSFQVKSPIIYIAIFQTCVDTFRYCKQRVCSNNQTAVTNSYALLWSWSNQQTLPSGSCSGFTRRSAVLVVGKNHHAEKVDVLDDREETGAEKQPDLPANVTWKD